MLKPATTNPDTFDGHDVTAALVAVTGTAGLLIDGAGDIHIGDSGVIAIEWVCTALKGTTAKDTDGVDRVAVLKAGGATMIDPSIVHDALEQQRVTLERANGIQRLPIDDNGDGG